MIRVYCALAIWFSFLAVITGFSQTTDSLTIALEKMERCRSDGLHEAVTFYLPPICCIPELQ